MTTRHALLTLSLSLALNLAIAAPPSDASLQELLEVTKSEALLDQMYGSVDQMVRQGIASQTQGRTLNDEQRRILDLAPSRIGALMRKEFGWTTMRPIYVGIYREVFTQEEIDGLIKFYRSPEGQAAINKMPLVIQRTMQVMQVQMQALMPKIEGAMREIMQEAKLPPKS
jgi:uncharacterized protein